MKNITLVSNSDIVKKVFKLALDDEGYELNTLSNIQDLSRSDMILLDEDFVDTDLEQIKQYCDNIGFIQKKSSDEDESSFNIPRPFLPSTLREIVNKNILNVAAVANDIEIVEDEDSDESIIDINSLHAHGGSLDKDELYSLKETLRKEHISSDDVEEFEHIEEDELFELEKMIDQVIDEIESNNTDIVEDENIVVLGKHNIEQLKPLFSIINQDMVDKLSAGETVELKIKLKEE